MKQIFTLVASLLAASAAQALPPPSAPTDPLHPGSKTYSFGVSTQNLTCQGRAVNVVLPTGPSDGRGFAVVVYGHGQALGLSAYKGTFEHLAKKGVAVVFPAFDNGFFDQDWNRMGRDFVSQADCALAQFRELDSTRVVYSGHSKGAYVASIAAGLATGMGARSVPKAIVLFEPAGYDASTLNKIPADSALTVVFSDRDTIVSRDISDKIYAGAASKRRQLILVKSYNTTPALVADHMWPLTEKGAFGGGPESSLHYFGSWKWLVAAAQDLTNGSRYEDPFLYGLPALDKGIPELNDEVLRNWNANGMETDADLVLKVKDFRNQNGNLLVALYDKADAFPETPNRAVRVAKEKVTRGTLTLTLRDLKPGTYAAVVVHDENGNDKLDKGNFGIPKEGFGFSKNPPVRFSPPTFEEAKIVIQPGSNTSEITLNYM